MVKFIDKAEIVAEMKEKPAVKFKPGFDLRNHINVKQVDADNVVQVAEFIQAEDFGSEWYSRQRYEVFAGREREPLLYQELFSGVEDANLPKVIPVYELGPAGVIFQQVLPGGEVKFITLTESDHTVTINVFATGLQYDRDLFLYNQTWNLSLIERRVGTAYNALLNHIHLYPIIAYTYGASNQTAASTEGSSLVEKFLRTIELAITNAEEDGSNPRYGPYDLMIAPAQRWIVERALMGVPQQGFTLQSKARDMIRNVIVYGNTTVTRGKKSVTYTGVSSGTGYLCSIANKDADFQSWVKIPLDTSMGNPDVSRRIEMQTVWETHLASYVNPLRAVEEITWPTS